VSQETRAGASQAVRPNAPALVGDPKGKRKAKGKLAVSCGIHLPVADNLFEAIESPPVTESENTPVLVAQAKSKGKQKGTPVICGSGVTGS
jgi:hypothetical protein